MSARRARNLTYFASSKVMTPGGAATEEEVGQLLDEVGRQAARDRVPSMEELEHVLQETLCSLRSGRDGRIQGADHEDSNAITSAEESGGAEQKAVGRQNAEPQDGEPKGGGGLQLVAMLQERGYITDGRRWLTEKGFLAVSSRLLQDVLRDLGAGEPGLHETRFWGSGGVTADSTRRFEPADDISYLSVPHTLINSVLRLSRNGTKVSFPISVEPEDLEGFERTDDVRAAIAYCIDLSSTMKYVLPGGASRMEAAKKALWSLCALNRKFFPNDSVYVIGFASLASLVQPRDIPHLRTYGSGDGFLHYTNYQSALRYARKVLRGSTAQNKRIVMITDGQPSACFVEGEQQRNELVSEKPYAKLYSPDDTLLAKIGHEKRMRPDTHADRLVYLCYRYKTVDGRIHARTLEEARRCLGEGIAIDSIVISDEEELLEYIKRLERELRGRTYHVRDSEINRILIADYLSDARRVLRSTQHL